MNTCRLLILAAFCVIFLVLFVQGENENEISETDVELQDHNLREKRSAWWPRRNAARSRRFLTRRFYRRPSYRRSSYRRPSYRHRYRPRHCPRYKSLLRIVLKNVDCLNNTKCRSKQQLLFGTPTPSPSVAPSSSQVASSMPAVSPTPSSSPVMSVAPTRSQVVSSMPAVSPTPSSGSGMVSQTVFQVNI